MTWTCEIVEERLSEHLDGMLSAEEERSLAAHIERCTRCSALVTQVSGMLTSVHRLWPLQEPADLVPKILDQTLGPRRAKPQKWAGWLGWLRPVLQPRLAMGFATAGLALFFTLQAAGVSLEWKDLTPKNLFFQTNRHAHLLYARGAKFVNDLRVVYEIQSRLQSASEKERETEPKQNEKREQKRTRDTNQLNQRTCELCVLTTGLGGLPGRSMR